MNGGNVMRHLRNDNDISWVCQFCRNPFPWEVQPETFRHHLTRICESAPEDVKEAAQRREVEVAECSRSVNWEPTRILDASENNDSNFEAKTEGPKYECQEAKVSSVQRTQRGGNIVQRSNKRQRSAPEVSISVEGNDSNFKAKTEGSKYECQELQGVEEEVSSVQRTRREGIVQRHRSMPIPLPNASLTNRPVGDAFERNVEKIWSWLMDDQVLRVGIYGMGGLGKTTLMSHIQTLLEGQNSFEVYWITVCQDFSIYKLQNLIAQKIGLNFSDEEDEVKRAKTLAQAMQAKRKCVLILDDLWNYFDVDEVGIPVGVNTCKLVLTTRLLKVCRQMGCSVGNRIQLQRLSEKEAWILFTQELGNYGTEVEELAKAVSRECAGLPLGIRVMARSMKGICNVHTWRNTREELRESKVWGVRKISRKVTTITQ